MDGNCVSLLLIIMQDTQEIGEKQDECPTGAVQAGKDATYDHVVKYTGVLGLVQVLTILVSVVRNKLAAVWLGTVGLGLSSLYVNLTGFLSTVSNLGISFSSVKHVAELYEQGDMVRVSRFVEVVRTWSVWTAVFGMLVCILFSPLISWWAFDDDSHIIPVCLLSPMLAFMSVTGGELAVLKAVRRLKRVAMISVSGALATLLLTVPFYYLWGISGVVPGLVCSTAGVMAVHLFFSLKVFPWRVSLFNKDYFTEGIKLVRLGVPYVVAGFVNTATTLGVTMFIVNAGSLSDAGLYGMGYGLVLVYAGTFFTAVDSDYFPRLSAIHAERERMNLTVNRQVKVCLLLISPVLILFILSIPLIVYILYTSEFFPIVGMAVCASLHLFFKAMSLPAAYLSLAKGDALVYFCMEVAYDVVMMLLIVAFYLSWGILGTGVALALAGLFDLFLIYIVYGWRYGFRPDSSFFPFVAMQFACVSAAVCLGLQDDIGLKAFAGGAVFVCSVLLSVYVLRREVTLFSSFKARLMAKFGGGGK